MENQSHVPHKYLHIFILLLFTAPFFVFSKQPPSAHAQEQITSIDNIRFGVHPEKTRVVIELSRKTEYRSFILAADDDKPYRLVVDMPNFVWNAGSLKRPSNSILLDVRSGELEPGIKRIVLDLEKPAEIITAFQLPKSSNKPDRLVIDYRKISEQSFAQSKQKLFGNMQQDNKTFEQVLAGQTNINSKKPIKTVGDLIEQNEGMIVPPRKPAGSNAVMVTSPPPKKRTPLRKPLIILDAGHGGADPGAVGAGRLKEKNITLSAAKELKKALEETKRYRVILTRDDDRYLKLYQRVSIARKKDADLFISIHADSIDKPNVSGASIYTLSNKASDKQTARLAARENQVDLIAGVDLSHEDKDVANILIDLAMRDTMNQSKFFANTVVDHMKGHGIRILPRPHRYAGFAVLKAPDIPSVLVEIGFMSNRKEAKMLSTKSYQRKIALSLTKSIDAYFQKVRKNGT